MMNLEAGMSIAIHFLAKVGLVPASLAIAIASQHCKSVYGIPTIGYVLYT
jgi:hypothetical protein